MYSGEQPDGKRQLALAQGAVDLAQFMYRVVFAGGQSAAIELGQIQQFVCIGLTGESWLRSTAANGQCVFANGALRETMPDPQLRLRQYRPQRIALLLPGVLARLFAGLG